MACALVGKSRATITGESMVRACLCGLAASALGGSKSAPGTYYCRMCSRMDEPKAVTAAAPKLARRIYTMLTKGQECTDQGRDYHEQRYRRR